MHEAKEDYMSRWTEQFKQHPIHVDLENLGALLEATASEDIAQAQEIARLRKVHAFTLAVIDAVDPEIASPSVLGNMHGHVQGALNEVSAYQSNTNISYLHQANNHFDSVISYASSTPFTAFGTAKASLTKAATAYAEAMEQHAERLKNKVDQLSKEVEGEYGGLDTRANTATDAISKLEVRVSSMEAQLPTQLNSFNTAFQASETARSQAFEAWNVTYQEKLDSQYLLSAQKFAAGELAMGEHLDRAAKVLGAVVDTAQAGAYATYAGEEKASANLYRRLALGLMAAAALVLFLPEVLNAAKVAAELAASYTFDWKAALYRLPFSLVLFTPAVYLARESSRHRTNEVVNRRRQHILTTIGPYLALMDAKKKEEVLSDVAKSIFSEHTPISDDKAAETTNLIAQLTAFAGTLLKGK